ncbi:phospholipase D-like domain-containing protein [Mesorhizobium sp. M0041]|uniref:phospholipase D-like domain-containing protein n=1 Tax=Mesorhizobium sp. M0041 TaxID=2956856 RepID=UPI00333C25F8
MQIAVMAYNELKPPARERVDALLKLNPDYSTWTLGVTTADVGQVAERTKPLVEALLGFVTAQAISRTGTANIALFSNQEAGMRKSETGPVLRGRAIAGSHVVTLGWDIQPNMRDQQQKLLGFAIERSELVNGAVVEKYWLRGIKRFQDKDKGLAPGTPVSTSEHPIQGFQWGDYTPEPGRMYRYRIVPIYGEVKNLTLDDANALTIEVETEKEYLLDPVTPNDVARHDVYFNRGVIGSQAYARRFGNKKPDKDDLTSPEMEWLSRGLFRALLRFIGLADSHRYALRAAFYEFHVQAIANSLAKAIEAGADVKVVYDAVSSYKKDNEETISNAGLDQYGAAIPRTASSGIRHNKFVVLIEDNVPIAVWTGSTNISINGFFGQSNVGHIVWDRTVAEAYLKYWKRLADPKMTVGKIRQPNRNATNFPAGKAAANSILPVFSARDPEGAPSPTLQWYADRMAEAKQVICFTAAFNIDQVFLNVLNQPSDTIRYVVKDDDLSEDEVINTDDRGLLFAAGGYLGKNALANFLAEIDNPFTSNIDYIHDKFMLIDPLSDDPTVISGSANFSQPSQNKNDENMLVIRSDTRVADIYFGEFMRLFDHHYARYIVRKLTKQGSQDPDSGYLRADTKKWLPTHFSSTSYKSRRRKYFSGF